MGLGETRFFPPILSFRVILRTELLIVKKALKKTGTIILHAPLSYEPANVCVFVAVLQTGDMFAAVCSGCDTLFDKFSEEGPPAPVPVCSEELEHSHSAGGNATVEMLEIAPGYWRATTTSRNILACLNADACEGGITDTSGYCAEGYKGPCESSFVLFLRLRY